MKHLRTPIPAILSALLFVFTPYAHADLADKTPIEARLASCNPAVVRAAVEEVLNDPQTLREPMVLFQAAQGVLFAGDKEQAAFLYLVARARTLRQIQFEQGDRPELIQVMRMSVGSFVMPSFVADPELARRVVDRVVEWDRATPDPFREREDAKAPEIAKILAEIDAVIPRMAGEAKADPTRIAAAEQTEAQVKRMQAERCGPGTVDAVDRPAALARITAQAESLVRTHPLVLAKAEGSVKSVDAASWAEGPSKLPGRLTMAVKSANGKSFYAEVDAEVTVTADHQLGSVNTSLACLTDLSLGQRQAGWRDVCRGDPHAVRP